MGRADVSTHTQLEGGKAGVLGADLAVLAIGVASGPIWPGGRLTFTEHRGVHSGQLSGWRPRTTRTSTRWETPGAGHATLSVSGADSPDRMAGPANKQGRIAADNICNRDSRLTAPRAPPSSMLRHDGRLHRTQQKATTAAPAHSLGRPL